MAQLASAARQNFSLTTLIRTGWDRLVRSSNHAMSKGIYGEDITFTDSIERELNQRELHPYTY
jgi:hypothetical protein